MEGGAAGGRPKGRLGLPKNRVKREKKGEKAGASRRKKNVLA